MGTKLIVLGHTSKFWPQIKSNSSRKIDYDLTKPKCCKSILIFFPIDGKYHR
jgi:hypothetical protein